MKPKFSPSIRFKIVLMMLVETQSFSLPSLAQNLVSANPVATPSRVQVSKNVLPTVNAVTAPTPVMSLAPAATPAGALPSSSWSIYLDDMPIANGLTWKKEAHAVSLKTVAGKPAYVTQLNGSFKDKKHSSLLVDSNPVPVARDGSFSFEFPLQTSDSSTPISTVDSLGNIQKEKIIVKFIPPLAQVPVKITPPLPPTPTPLPIRVEKSSYSTTVGTSFTLINYEQTSLAKFKEYAVTGKAVVTYTLPASRFSYSGGIFFTGVPFGTTSVEKVTLSFFGFNARVGYELPWLSRPWKLSIMGGLYFTSANARGGNAFNTNLGYSVSGVQGFLTLSRSFRRGDSLGFYAKFAPLSDGMSFSPASSEIAFGNSYHFVPDIMGRGFGVAADYSRTQLAMGSLVAKTSTVSFGANYHF